MAADLETWKWAVTVRTEGVRTAATRSRFVLIIASVISGAFIFTGFNYFFSWGKTFALGDAPLPIEAAHIKHMQDRLVDEWIRSQSFEVPVLGVKLLVNDLTILLPPCLFIVLVWLYFSVRREHFTVGRLLSDVYREFPKDVREPAVNTFMQTVYHAISAFQVFTVVKNDSPIRKLDQPFSLEGSETPTIRDRAISALSRRSIGILLYFPCLAILFCFVGRVLMFFPFGWIASPYRLGHEHHIDLTREYVLYALTFVSSVVFGGMSFWFARRIRAFDQATRHVLDEYAKDVLLVDTKGAAVSKPPGPG